MSAYLKCKADPENPDFIAQFEDLHPEFKEELFLGKVEKYSVYRYVVLTYDTESPYVIKYRDWATRRKQTARQCRFPKNGSHYHEEAENIILGKNFRTNKVILRYLFLQNDIDFMQYQSYQALYYKQVKASIEEDYDNPGFYEKLKNNIDSLSTELKSLQTAIFHGDETKEMKKALYDFTSKITLDFRPEHRAKRIEKEEPPVDENPYPDSYLPEKLTFNNDE